MNLAPLDLVSAHPWQRVTFTTYALSLSFFEAVILDALVRGGGRQALLALWILAAAGPAAAQSFPGQGSSESGAAPAAQRSPGVDKEEDHKPIDPDTESLNDGSRVMMLITPPVELRPNSVP